MAISPINFCRKKSYSKEQGLTLIEVLIALAIVSIAMTAIIKAFSQNIRSTEYLQNKTVALYVGQQLLNEARVGVLKLPNIRNEKTEMLGRDWYSEIEALDTPNKHIKKIKVAVFAHDPVGKNETPIINMETYLYHE